MKKPDLLIPAKPLAPGDSLPLCGRMPSPYWMSVDWWALARKRHPDIKLTLEKGCHEDWLLYDQIEILSEQAGVDFIDAAHWGLQRALGNQFQSAREMLAQRQVWDGDILYVCTIFGIQLCHFFGPKNVPEQNVIFAMIESLLISEEEILANTPAKDWKPS